MFHTSTENIPNGAEAKAISSMFSDVTKNVDATELPAAGNLAQLPRTSVVFWPARGGSSLPFFHFLGALCVTSSAKMPAANTGAKFSNEEELLLQDFSRNVSTKSSALFYGNAFIVSAIPICKYLHLSSSYF